MMTISKPHRTAQDVRAVIRAQKEKRRKSSCGGSVAFDLLRRRGFCWAGRVPAERGPAIPNQGAAGEEAKHRELPERYTGRTSIPTSLLRFGRRSAWQGFSDLVASRQRQLPDSPRPNAATPCID